RTRAAFASLAIPATGEVICLCGLNFVHGVKDDHPFRDFGRVVAELAAATIAAPDSERSRLHPISSMTRLKSSRIGGTVSSRICISPASSFQTTVFTLANSALFSG